MEIWKSIKGFENYEVSNLGNIRSLNYLRTKKIKLLKQTNNTSGYPYVVIYGKIRKTITVHRLVMSNFSEVKIDLQINHINGIKTDNRLENLEWCTAKENVKHALENNLWNSVNGEKHHNSKLTNDKVLEIRKKGKYDTWKKIGEDYSVSLVCIRNIINNKTWKNI